MLFGAQPALLRLLLLTAVLLCTAQEGSFDSIVQGAKYVFHAACARLQPGIAARVHPVCPLLICLRLPCRSPFIIQVEDTQRDLIDPAVKGTRNVLAAAAKAKASVQRVVLTSSVAGLRLTSLALW